MLGRHQESGFHYFHVIPKDWGPFADYWTGYTLLGLTYNWISVITPSDFAQVLEVNKNDSKVFFILWTKEKPGLTKENRKCLIVPIYSEAIDDDVKKMLPDHIKHWQEFGQNAPLYDAIFVHTPKLVYHLNRGMNLPTYVFPAGYTTCPFYNKDYSNRNSNKIVYWGSMAGRRFAVVPYLLNKIKNLNNISGQFGQTLLDSLVDSRVALYIAHSHVWTFSTWRLWQGLAANTPHIAETGDSWPFEEDKHYLSIPHFEDGPWNEAKNKSIVDEIANLFANTNKLKLTVENNQDELSQFTLEYCMNTYAIPASLDLESKKQNAL